MVAERLFAFARGDVTRIGLFADELFFDPDVIFCLKRLGVACEIAIGDAEQFLERIEIGRFIDHQHTHDAQPDSVVKSLVDILDDVFQSKRLVGAVVFEIHDASVNDVAYAKTERPEL
jgi:hypothetical protein